MTILAGLPAIAALAYCPIKTPALKLSVANSASVALCGSVGVSSAITSTPASRAFLMAGTIAFVSLGVMRIALAPPLTMFSMAVTWVALSPSNFPAAAHQLGAFGFRRLHGAFLHLHEERVGIRLRDEAHHDFLGMADGCRTRGDAQQDR